MQSKDISWDENICDSRCLSAAFDSWLCSASFYTASHQFFQKDNNNWSWDFSPFHHPLSQQPVAGCWSLSVIELAIPEVSVLTPLLSSFTFSLCSYFTVPFFCLLSCIALYSSDIFPYPFFWYHFVGSMKDSIFRSKIVHLLHIWDKWTQVLVAAIWSYMVIDFTLQNFCHSRGVTLKLCWSPCWSLCASKSQNLLILLDFPNNYWQICFSLTSILSWFSSFFLHSSNALSFSFHIGQSFSLSRFLWILQFSVS